MNWKLAGEISGLIVAGLFLIPFSMSTVRAMIGIKPEPWDGLNDIAAAEARDAAEGWIHRSLSAFDIAFNVIVFRGQQDETISTHAYRASLEGKWWGIQMTKWLCWFQPNHGQLATTGDLWRATVRVKVLSQVLGIK